MEALLQLQLDVYGHLLACPELSLVNIKLYRKLAASGEVDLHSLVVNARAAKVGSGLIVEMPEITASLPNIPGPKMDAVIPILAIESPELNLGASGTLASAEQAIMTVCRTLHGWHVPGLGSFYCQGNIIEPITEFEGLVAYRARVTVMFPQSVMARTAPPAFSFADGRMTLTCTETASIYYTSEGSYPGTTTNLYSEPFLVVSGTTIRAAAYASGKLGSHVREAVILSGSSYVTEETGKVLKDEFGRTLIYIGN